MSGDDGPLIVGRIHGLRAWRIGVADGVAELRGHGEEPWAVGGEPTIARCLGGNGRRAARRRHRAPVADCSCGLYALHPHASTRFGLYGSLGSIGEAGDAFPTAVAGIVEAWGRIELHADGFRAEFARPHTLALIGADRESDVGRLIERLAERSGARLVELDNAEDLVQRCHEHGLGLAPATVRSLVPDDPPGADPDATAGSRPAAGASRVAKLGSRLGTVAAFALALLWYGAIGVIGVVLAIGVIRGIVEPSPVEFRAQHLSVVDQALVEVGGRLRYVAVVRNTSDQRLALAAFPTGGVFDRSGNRIVRLERRERIETRPSLAPGATGLVVDVVSGRPPARLPERLAYKVAIKARRAPAADDTTAPLRLSGVRLARDPCRLAVTAHASHRLRGATVGVLARDRRGEITTGGAIPVGRLDKGRSRQVVFAARRSECPGWWQTTEVYPQLLPANL